MISKEDKLRPEEFASLYFPFGVMLADFGIDIALRQVSELKLMLSRCQHDQTTTAIDQSTYDRRLYHLPLFLRFKQIRFGSLLRRILFSVFKY